MAKTEDAGKMTPFVTIEDIKNDFRCEADKAELIMKNPDLERFLVGRTWMVRRDLYNTFLGNLVQWGLTDYSRGFQIQIGPPIVEGKYYAFLVSVGLTREQIIEGWKNGQKKGNSPE